jgi:phage terminase small subunit
VAKNPASGLTDKQTRFCQEYLKDFNATAAYIRAGYSENAARVGASQLLTKPNIQAYLQVLRQKAENRTIATLERTMEEISRVAFANITNILSFSDAGVSFRDSEALPNDVTAAIESITMQESESENGAFSRKQSLKMHNKMSALGLLADFFGVRDDFNKARATLKRYGLALVWDEDSEVGWALEKYERDSGAGDN